MIKIKYKGIKITIIYCNYKNFNWYAIEKFGCIIIFINNNYKDKKLLHKIIKKYNNEKVL